MNFMSIMVEVLFKYFNLRFKGGQMLYYPRCSVIGNIVSRIKAQTSSGRSWRTHCLILFRMNPIPHMSDIPLLSSLNIRLKLWLMDRDCDTHVFLYASLLKIAGFKVLLAFTADRTHVAVVVHLLSSPKHSTQIQLGTLHIMD